MFRQCFSNVLCNEEYGGCNAIAGAICILECDAIVQSIRKRQTRLKFARPERWLDHNGCICPKMCVLTSANSRKIVVHVSHWKKAPYYVVYVTDTHIYTVA